MTKLPAEALHASVLLERCVVEVTVTSYPQSDTEAHNATGKKNLIYLNLITFPIIFNITQTAEC